MLNNADGWDGVIQRIVQKAYHARTKAVSLEVKNTVVSKECHGFFHRFFWGMGWGTGFCTPDKPVPVARVLRVGGGFYYL